MSIPTVADIHGMFETDIDDRLLENLIDAEAEEVSSRFGPDVGCVEEARPSGSFLSLSRKAGSITSVVEIDGTVETTLASDDYRLRNGGWRMERLTTGTNSRSDWGARVLVTFQTPDNARRWRVVVDLVKLALQYDALSMETAGENSSNHVKYQDERESILATLSNSMLPI